jgi:DNA-binding transcriptional ArsR family regulator
VSLKIDIGGLANDRLVFAPAPLLELMSGLHALSEPSHHPEQERWRVGVAAEISADVSDRLAEADLLWSPTVSDVALPFAALGHTLGRPGSTLAADLDLLDELPDEQFVGHALESAWGVLPPRPAASPLTSAASRNQALARAAARGTRHAQFVQRLLDNPGAVRVWLRELLEACAQEFFSRAWQQLLPQLSAESRRADQLLRQKGAVQALSDLSPAVSVSADGVITVDKLATGQISAVDSPSAPGVTFVPTVLASPHLWVLHTPGWRPVIVYPVAVPASSSDPLELLERRLEVLAHPIRLRICRNLAHAPSTTSKLALEYGLSTPEISRHLALLKKAGIVRSQRRGKYIQYHVDLQVLARLSGDLLDAVLR